MPFWRLYYHLIWSTRDREPLIQPEVEDRLFALLVKKASEMDCYVYAVNGWYDHVHILVAIPPKHSVAEVVKNLKGASAHFLNHGAGLEPRTRFAWQRGYGAVSLGERQIPIAEEYIANQKAHHAQQTWIPWLERETQLEEGADEVDQTIKPGQSTSLRETCEEYGAEGSPF